MKHDKIELPPEQQAMRPSKGPGAFVLWLVSLALFQPIGFAVICGFIAAMVVPTAPGFGSGMIIGVVVAMWLGGKFDGFLQSSETE